MENVTDVYTGPCSPESRYIKPFSVHYKQVSVACTDKRYRATGPHRVTGPESTAWLLPLTGTVVGDVSANNRASNVAAWPCETCGVRGPGGCLIVRRFDSPKVSCIG